MRLKDGGTLCCALMIAASSVISISCNRSDPKLPKVDTAVRLFNSRFNAGRFNEIYADADPRFQQSVNEEAFTKKLAALLQEHGPIESSGINGFEDLTRWQRLFPEFRPTRFIGLYSHCKSGGFQELFKFNVTGVEATLLEFETSIDDANRKLRD